MIESLQRLAAERAAASNLFAFLHWLGTVRGQTLAGWAALSQWAREDAAAFWSATWDFARLIGEKGGGGTGAPFMRGGRFSYAENVLRHAGTREAVVALGQDGRRRAWSRDRLRAEVAAYAAAFRGVGIGVGDRVGDRRKDGSEAMAAFLGANAIGAVWSADECRIVIEPETVEEFLAPHRGGFFAPVRMGLDAPLAILAGGVVQEQGVLLRHACELLLAADVKPDDRLFCPAAPGSAAWLWRVSALMTGATIVLFDGDGDAAAEERATILAGPARWIGGRREAGEERRLYAIAENFDPGWGPGPPALAGMQGAEPLALFRAGRRGGRGPRRRQRAEPG
jgi:hypothetical protein